MTFVDGPVRVSVPATSANLGPGFDALGLALDLRDRLEAEVLPDGLLVEVEGDGSTEVPRDATHLVVRAMHLGFDALGERPSGLRLSCHNVIPHSRGLGSSSAAIVAGLALARALVLDGDDRMDDDQLFALAAELEGHPDNVGPACFGGFVICGRDAAAGDAGDDFYAVSSVVSQTISAVVLIPPGGVATTVARGLIPASVSHADAAANSGRTALLVAALAGRPEQLHRATRDLLHQSFRRPVMTQSVDLVDSLRASGLAAVVSGAGPTVLVFSDGADTPTTAGVMERCPPGWRALHLNVDRRGVEVERSPRG